MLHDWAGDPTDLIVATSAFGLGVDKGDVRAIVHACLPENTDRFYQEVGRGGRDGMSSVSLLCLAPEDLDVAWSLTRTSRITVPRAVQRWEALRRSGNFAPGRHHRMWIDLNAVPAANVDTIHGNQNRGWNEHTVLLMERAGLLTTMDTRDDAVADGGGGAPPETGAWLLIHLNVARTTSDQDALTARLEQARTAEWDEIRGALRDLRQLVVRQARGGDGACLAYRFQQLYPGAERACGGCPDCRRRVVAPYTEPLPLLAELAAPPPRRAYLAAAIKGLLGGRGACVAHWAAESSSAMRAALRRMLVDLVGGGFQQLVVGAEFLGGWDEASQFVRALAMHADIPHLVVDHATLANFPDHPLYDLPTAILYPVADAEADRLYRAIRRRGEAGITAPMVHIVRNGLYLASEYGRFLDRVNGLTIAVGRLADLVQQANVAEVY